MKVRDKKVQKMTKDGLVEENLTDKSSVRVSNRASDVQMGRKQGEKEENLVDKSPRQSERSGKNIRPSVQKSRDAPELIRTEKQSEDFEGVQSEIGLGIAKLHFELGAGNGSCKIYNLDFPDVIAVRNQLLPAGDREENIPCNLNDTEWFTKIDASEGAIFFASGVFYYFLTEQVRTLVQAMADSFPGGVLVFDAANRTAVKMIAKTWLKSAKIQDVGAYFAVSDAKSELSTM